MKYEAFPDYWNVDVGVTYFTLGDFENSVLYLREYMDVGLDPHWLATYRILQSIYNIFGQWDEALNALEVGLERNPRDRLLMVFMIRQQLMLDDKEKANEWFERYKAVSKKAVVGLARGYIAYGDHYVLLGDHDKADEYFTKALSQFDARGDQIRSIAASFIGINKITKAQEILVDAGNRYSNNTNILRGLSRLYRAKQEYSKAVEYGEKVMALNPADDLDLKLAKALFHVASGESSQAKAEWQSLINQYKKLLNAPSTHPFNYYSLGAIYALKGDVQAALEMLESAFEKGSRGHSYFLYDPDLDNVRNDARTKEGFAYLLEKVKASYPAIARNKGAEK